MKAGKQKAVIGSGAQVMVVVLPSWTLTIALSPIASRLSHLNTAP
jgi:hypothetical protein